MSEIDPRLASALPEQPGNSDVCFVWPGPIGEAVAHLERHGVAVETGPVARLGARGEGTSVLLPRPRRQSARVHLLRSLTTGRR